MCAYVRVRQPLVSSGSRDCDLPSRGCVGPSGGAAGRDGCLNISHIMSRSISLFLLPFEWLGTPRVQKLWKLGRDEVGECCALIRPGEINVALACEMLLNCLCKLVNVERESCARIEDILIRSMRLFIEITKLY